MTHSTERSKNFCNTTASAADPFALCCQGSLSYSCQMAGAGSAMLAVPNYVVQMISAS